MSRVFKAQNIALGKTKTLNPLEEQISYKKNKQKTIEDAIHIKEEINSLKKEMEEALKAAQEEKSKILAEAQQKREEILQEARQQKEQIFKEAYEEGISQGREDGYSKGYEEARQLIDEAKDIKQKTLAERKSVAFSLEEDIIDLILKSIKKIIDHEIQEDNELLLNLVQKGIEKCTYTESLIVRVSEEDYETIYKYKNKIYSMTEGIAELEVKKDPALSSRSIIVETLSGTVDASLNVQIKQIEEAFNDLLAVRNE